MLSATGAVGTGVAIPLTRFSYFAYASASFLDFLYVTVYLSSSSSATPSLSASLFALYVAVYVAFAVTVSATSGDHPVNL